MVELSGAKTRLIGRLRRRRGRAREGLVLVEGPRAVRTAIEAGAVVEFVVTVEGASGTDALDGLDAGPVERFTVSGQAFEALADTEAPQGILAVVREPAEVLSEADFAAARSGASDAAMSGAPDPAGRTWRRTLVLDRVQDPGNAGTLIRSAAALGVEQVIALDGTVDPWNPKSMRASAGEGFRIRVVRADWDRFAEWRSQTGVTLLVADGSGVDVRAWPEGGGRPDGGARPVGKPRPAGGGITPGPGIGAPVGPWALVIGNEGNGPRPEVLAAADRVVALPLAAGVDSLNAAMAGSILMWELGPAREGGHRTASPTLEGPDPSQTNQE